jgi:hypothetical protein
MCHSIIMLFRVSCATASPCSQGYHVSPLCHALKGMNHMKERRAVKCHQTSMLHCHWQCQCTASMLTPTLVDTLLGSYVTDIFCCNSWPPQTSVHRNFWQTGFLLRDGTSTPRVFSPRGLWSWSDVINDVPASSTSYLSQCHSL